jgi:hypothetical protein
MFLVYTEYGINLIIDNQSQRNVLEFIIEKCTSCKSLVKYKIATEEKRKFFKIFGLRS